MPRVFHGFGYNKVKGRTYTHKIRPGEDMCGRRRPRTDVGLGCILDKGAGRGACNAWSTWAVGDVLSFRTTS